MRPQSISFLPCKTLTLFSIPRRNTSDHRVHCCCSRLPTGHLIPEGISTRTPFPCVKYPRPPVVLPCTPSYSRMRNTSRFTAVLHLQRHHLGTKSPLFIDYAKNIRKICIGKYTELPPPAPNWEAKAFDLVRPAGSAPDDDISVLAPVLLSAGSLSIDGQSLALLCHCLQLAWRSMTEDHMEVDGPTKNLPWRTSALTVFGEVPSWKPLQSTPEGVQFLDSLSSVTFLLNCNGLVMGTPDELHSSKGCM